YRCSRSSHRFPNDRNRYNQTQISLAALPQMVPHLSPRRKQDRFTSSALLKINRCFRQMPESNTPRPASRLIMVSVEIALIAVTCSASPSDPSYLTSDP